MDERRANRDTGAIPIRVLLVEDSDADARLVLRHLSAAGFRVESHRVESEEPFREALQSARWDVVIADYNLPRFSAPAALAVVRGLGSDIPFLIVSGSIGEESAIAALKSGANDFIQKDRLARLAPAIQRECREAISRAAARRAADALAKREQQLAEAQRIAHIGSWELDVASGRVTCSEEQFRILGLDPKAGPPRFEQVVARVHPDDAPRFAEFYASILREAKAIETELRIVRPDGVERIVHARGVTGAGRTADRVLGTMQDITERKTLEVAVDRTARQEALRVDVATQFAEKDDIASALRGCAEAMVARLGVLRASIRTLDGAGQKLVRRAHAGFELPTDIQNDVIDLANVRGTPVRTGRPWIVNDEGDIERSFPGFARSGHHVRGVIACPIFGDRVPIGFVAAACDVRIDAPLEHALTTVADAIARGVERWQHEAQRNWLGAIVDSSDDAIVGISLDGMVQSWNRGAEQVFGFTREEAIGRYHADFATQQHRDEAIHVFERIRRGERIPGYESVRVTKDGARIHVALTMSIVRDGSGKPIGIAQIARDVTKRRQLQHQLMMADRMASVGTLAAGAAHEINNPLAYVLGNIDFALRETKGALGLQPTADLSAKLRDVDQALNEAKEGAERVRHVVRDLKLFSRSEEEQRGAIDLRSVAESSIRMAWNEIRHRAKLVKDYADVAPVDADPSRMGQVLLNLLVNAAQAIPEGHADRNEIRVSTRMVDHKVIVEVRDSGGGIPPEIRDRIFDPFFTTKAVGVGTGLGLSICHGIVTSVGGEISVESEVGKGTTFRIVLPASKEKMALAPAGGPAPRTVTRGRVLLVDDDPLVLSTLRRTLSSHEITSKTRAREALALIESGTRYDAIVCDVMMPEMTGADLHAAIARLDASQADRMIFVTGGAFTPAARQFLSRVKNPRIQKPFDAASLRQNVTDMVAGARASEQSRSEQQLPTLDASWLDGHARTPGTSSDDMVRQHHVVFQTSVTAYLRALRADVAARRYDRARTHVLAIAGACASFGAIRMGHVASTLDPTGGDHDALMCGIDRLENELRSVDEAVAARLIRDSARPPPA